MQDRFCCLIFREDCISIALLIVANYLKNCLSDTYLKFAPFSY